MKTSFAQTDLGRLAKPATNYLLVMVNTHLLIEMQKKPNRYICKSCLPEQTDCASV